MMIVNEELVKEVWRLGAEYDAATDGGRRYLILDKDETGHVLALWTTTHYQQSPVVGLGPNLDRALELLRDALRSS